jgi:PAS domain S-box-containing protein
METEDHQVRVLLVEDSLSDAELLREYLNQYPLQAFEVQHAERLAEAIDLLKQSTFDVTLLDLTLPDSSGLETCVRMRRAARRVPIIVLTGVDDEKIAWEAMCEGVEDYLVKGQIHGGSLARAIRYAVERSRTQQALRESESRLKLAQQSAGAGVWDWDMVMGKLHWSPELFRLFGLDPSETEASFDVWRTVLHPEDRRIAEARTEQAVRDRTPLKSEYRIILGSGEMRWINALGNTVYDEEGQAQRMSGICIDITERRQQLNERLEEKGAERTEQLTTTIDHLQEEVARRVIAEGRLLENSRMLEGFFQHTITPLAFLDRHLNYVRVNAAYAKANRRLPDYFVGKNCSSFYPNEQDQAIFKQVVQTKQPYYAHAKPSSNPRDPGRVTYWNWQLTPLLDESGDVQFLVFNLEDVSERQTAYQELKQRTYQLQRLALELSQAEDRERRRLAEVLHDDLQQVLAGAKFHLGILSDRIKGDETRAAGTGPSRSDRPRGSIRLRGLAVGHAQGVSLQSRPGDSVQRDQTRQGQGGQAPPSAKARADLADYRGSRAGLRPASARHRRWIWVVQHPRTCRVAWRSHEDPQRQRSRQHVSHCCSGRRSGAGARIGGKAGPTGEGPLRRTRTRRLHQ